MEASNPVLDLSECQLVDVQPYDTSLSASSCCSEQHGNSKRSRLVTAAFSVVIALVITCTLLATLPFAVNVLSGMLAVTPTATSYQDAASLLYSFPADVRAMSMPLARRHTTAYRNNHRRSKHLTATDSHDEKHTFVAQADATPGTVYMQNYYNRLYTGDIYVGSPQQRFRVVFDTGSSDLWVFSSETAHPILPYLNYYNHSQSVTYTALNQPWGIQYGKGQAYGALSSDVVTVAGYPLVNQIFAETTNFSQNFEDEDEPLDGILGLAFTSLSVGGYPTVMDNLFSSGLIANKVFSFVLTNEVVTEQSQRGKQSGEVVVHSNSSQFLLGSINHDMTPHGVQWMPIVQNLGMWLIMLDQLSVGNIAVGEMCNPDRPCAALIDTGTSFIGLPAASFRKLAGSIIAHRPDCTISEGQVWCTLDTHVYLPTISFYFSGIEYALQPADYMVGNVVGIMSIDAKSPDVDWFILGDIFLKTFYCVFDMEQHRIGIALPQPVHTPRPVPINHHIIEILLTAAVMFSLVSVSMYAMYQCWTRLRSHPVTSYSMLPATPASYTLIHSPMTKSGTLNNITTGRYFQSAMTPTLSPRNTSDIECAVPLSANSGGSPPASPTGTQSLTRPMFAGAVSPSGRHAATVVALRKMTSDE